MLFSGVKVLSEDEIHIIDLNIKEVLDKIGICCKGEKALDIFEKGGARVDKINGRVYIPKGLVEWALSQMPNSIVFYDAFGQRVAEIGADERHYGSQGYATRYLDKEGKLQNGTYAAEKYHAQLCDAIDEISFMMPAIQPDDIDPDLQDVYMMKACLEGTRKPTHTVANSGRAAETMIAMHAEIAGGYEALRKKPRNMFNVCTFSPLTIREDACEVIEASAKYCHPCMFSTGTMAGATAPVTLAGSVVQSLAEVIAHIVLAQLSCPGMPNSMLTASRIFDMKYCACTGATPEYYLIKTAAVQMAQYYGIPAGGMGLMTDSNEYDAQYGWEKIANGLIARQAGMTLIWGFGMMSQLNLFGFEGMVIDTEIVRYIERIARGIEVNRDSLAFDVIAAEAETSNFLANDHTLERFNKECYIPELADRAIYSNYLERGNYDLRTRAREKCAYYEDKYDYKKGEEMSEKFQKIIDEMMG